MKHETERVYDELMAPLVTELIRIAKEHNIGLFLTAPMILDDGKVGHCTTKIPCTRAEFGGANNRHGLCVALMQGDTRFDKASALTITRFRAQEDK